MALPKYRVSKSRGRKRRAHYLRVEIPSLSKCPNCGAVKLPHRVCPECGFYKGRKVVFEKVKEEKEKK
jgi:large subunit ribosomal protein L32